jgi:hypothetical protein
LQQAGGFVDKDGIEVEVLVPVVLAATCDDEKYSSQEHCREEQALPALHIKNIRC